MIYLILTLFFIGLQGFFAGMETGMVSVMRPRAEHAARQAELKARLRRSGKKELMLFSDAAHQILFFIEHPGIMIATSLLGVNICVVCASLSAKNFMAYCGLRGTWGILIATCILSVVLLSCEIIPKNWFRQAPYERCSLFVRILYFTYLILFFPVRLFAAFTGFLNNHFSAKDKNSGEAVLREDFRLFLRESESGGAVDSETASILDKAMSVPAMRLKEVCRPRSQVCSLSSDTTLREAFAIARTHGVDKFPVYISEKNETAACKIPCWCGIFNLYDGINSFDESLWNTVTVSACLSQLYSLKENDGIIRALDLSRAHRVSLFVIENENGEQTGILSPSDLAALLFE